MKKNFTKYAGITLVALLTACNGSAVTKEEAAKVAKGITEHQAKEEDLYSKLHYSAKGNGYDDDEKAITMSAETWLDTENHFLHMKSEQPNDEGKTEKTEIYMGAIGSKYYSIDMVEKTYTEFSSLTLFETVYTVSASAAKAPVASIGSGVVLEEMVASAKDEPTEDDPVFEFKSKGEGHLYVAVTEKDKDDDTGADVTSKNIVIFNNYLLSYWETVETDSKTKSNNVTTKMNVDYNVNAKMPSLNGLTKK